MFNELDESHDREEFNLGYSRGFREGSFYTSIGITLGLIIGVLLWGL